MPGETDPSITAYVRHEILGVDTNEVRSFATKLQVSPAWVTNVRKGKQAVGGTSLNKIAKAYFGGSIDELMRKARAFERKHPELVKHDEPASAARSASTERAAMLDLLVADGIEPSRALSLVTTTAYYKFGSGDAAAILRAYRAIRELARTGKLPGEGGPPDLGGKPDRRTIGVTPVQGAIRRKKPMQDAG